MEKTDANAATYTDERKEGIKTFKYIGIKNPTDGTINDTGLYYGTNFWSSTSENGITIPMGENNSHVCNQNCVNESTAAVGHAVMGGGADYHDESEGRTKVRTFYTSATKYLIVDGELGKQLKCEAGGENFSYKIVDGKFMHPMLYRTGETGMPEVVMAVVKKDPDELAASTAPVYVVSANPDSYGDNTVTYKVYSASSAEEMELVMRPENAFDSAGYWTYNFDEDGLAKKGSPCNEIASYGDTCFEGVTFNGLSNSKISVLDSNGNPVTPPTGASVTNTKVVDLRTAAEIASSGVAKITSTAQMDALYKAGKVIYMNVWAGKSSVNTIFIIGSQFDSSTGEQTGGIHDNYTGVVYVANPISANIPTKVYDTQGQEKVITLTQNSTVTGFAKIKVDKGQIILEAVPVTDQRYHVGEAETGVVNNAITTASGLSLNLTAATKYADLTAMNVTDKATFESAVSNFDLVLGVMDDGNGNAAMIVVVGVVDPNVSDGMVIYVARELANNGGAGMVTVDHSGNPNYPIYYSNVILPDGVQKMSGSYYKVEQSNGTTNLSFSHNYAAADGDVYYIQKRGVPGESVKALIIDSTSNAAMKDKWVYLKMPALPDTMTGATRTTSRFWTIQSGLAYRFLGVYNGTASQGGSDVGSYKLSYHDKISAVDGAAMTITRQNAHNSDGSPKTPCSGTPWNHTDSCGSIPNEQRREIVLTAGFSNNTRIINLTDKTIDGTTVTEKLESIKTLSGNGEVIVNLYAADGVQTSATIDVVLVLPIDPADIVIPAVTP